MASPFRGSCVIAVIATYYKPWQKPGFFVLTNLLCKIYEAAEGMLKNKLND